MPQVPGNWGVLPHVLCLASAADLARSAAFVEEVLGATLEAFPGSHVHLGRLTSRLLALALSLSLSLSLALALALALALSL